jgi:hypothetical protein
MSKLIKSRAAQYPLVADFVANFDDTMDNVAGAEVDFGKTNTDATVFAIIPLPKGAVVTGGSVTTNTAFDAATYNVTVGDTADNDRYLTTTDKKSAGITSLVPTGYVSDGEDVVVAVTAADVCTAGKLTVLVEYVKPGKVSEVAL